MMRKGISSRFVSIILLIVIIGGFLVFSLQDKQTSPWRSIEKIRQSPIPTLWERRGIYIEPNDQPLMAVEGNRLLFIGSSKPADIPFHVIAVDKNTGSEIWEYGIGNETCLATSASLVFVGGVGKVDALNANDGSIIWTANLPFTRSVTKLFVRNNILYVDTVSTNHFLLEVETGKILQSINYATGNVPIWSDHQMNLVFGRSIMYSQKQTGLPNQEAEIIAMDNSTGTQIWSSKVPSASRIVANSSGAYILTLDGKLVRFDPENGSETEIIQFTPEPTLLHHSEKGTAWELGYHVAVDANNQLIFVYFEDSTQLFAYRFPQIQNTVVLATQYAGLGDRRQQKTLVK